MNLLKNTEIKKKIRAIDAKVKPSTIIKLQEEIEKITVEIIRLAKKSSEQQGRKSTIFSNDIERAVEIFGEIKGQDFLFQLESSNKEFFEKKKEELGKWKE